ncbi:MAG: NTP transferase domain-containing protein [Phycisphaerales bacterium]|nr:NTP transferase domain-containing protein [Phycisphaerales bacterium]
MAMHPFAIALLAGGRSSRMGEPKHAVRMPDGRTMSDHVLDQCVRVCDTIVVAGPHDTLQQHTCIPDNTPWTGHGPLAGVEAVLASGIAARWLIVPCDMPWLTADVLQSMRHHDATGVVCIDKAGPLPMRIDTAMIGEVRSALEREQLALRSLPCVVHAHRLAICDESIIRDIDRPDQLPQ